MTSEALLGHLPRRSEHGEGNRQIESRSFFTELRRSEIDGQAPVRPVQLRGSDATAHALLGLLAGAIRQADDRERRQSVLQVCFDLDAPRVETDQRMGDRPCEHVADASGEAVTCLSQLRAD